jgi:hypothetical protein
VAVRHRVPLLVGIFGPSGSGKTWSALELAFGIISRIGGKVFVIDTESRRALHYVDHFPEYFHVEMKEPYSPLDYLDCINFCIEQGASVVIIDSLSHEHDGPGGVLDWHDRILEEKAGDNWEKREKLTFGAWRPPKDARKKLIERVKTSGITLISCFRAQPKTEQPKKGEKAKDLGFMPIAGKEYLWEQTVTFLLYPNAAGRFTYTTQAVGERQMLKLPRQFHELLKQERPLDRKIGEALADWAEGDASEKPKGEEPEKPAPAEHSAAWDDISKRLAKADTVESLEAIGLEVAGKGFSAAEKEALKVIYKNRQEELK